MSVGGTSFTLRERFITLLASILASGAVLWLMFWARNALQVRSLPERIMEAMLLVIPPAQFEAAIERFGPAAKDYALLGTEVGMFVALIIVAFLALTFIACPLWLLALGPALWLVTMVAIMPLTGAGLFGATLLQGPLLVNAVYLGIGFVFASILLLRRSLPQAAVQPGPIFPTDPAPARRVFLSGVAGVAVTYVATLFFGRNAGKVVSSLPLATLPTAATSGSTASQTATTTAQIAATQSSAASNTSRSLGVTTSSVTSSAAPTTATSAAATTAPAPTPASVYPDPPPVRSVSRDNNGALVAVNRPKGVQQPAMTANSDFYVVTKNAAGDPHLEARDWRLIIDGAVNHAVQLDYLTLRKLPAVSVYKTLECISNLTAKCDLTAFGCDLISTAKWTGARLPDVLALAGGLSGGVTTLAAFGADEFSSALPASVATDPNVLVVYMMNDQILPREHGFPARLIVPDHYGFKSAKWLVNLKPMTQSFLDWYGQRNWNPSGIVKTMARIDVPAPGATVPAGSSKIAGIAYGGSRGVATVEFSADGGKSWQIAALEPAIGADTFVRWSGAFTAGKGAAIELTARATDGTGQLQVEQFSLPQPDGGGGWNSIMIRGA